MFAKEFIEIHFGDGVILRKERIGNIRLVKNQIIVESFYPSTTNITTINCETHDDANDVYEYIKKEIGLR